MNQKKSERLQEEIEKRSVNQLRCIEPEILMEMLDTSSAETVEIVKYLHQERLLYYRYRFYCLNCGDEYTVYEQNLKREGFLCENCGQEYTYDDIKTRGYVVYDIKKKELLEALQEENIDFTKESLEPNVIDFLKVKEEGEKMGTVVMNISGGQVNYANGNATINAVQNGGISQSELERVIEIIRDNASKLGRENAETVIDSVEMIKEELLKPEPEKKIINSGIKLLVPMITIANGIPVLAENIQKFIETVSAYIH